MDAGQDVGQIGLGVQAVHLGGFNDGHGAGQRFGSGNPSAQTQAGGNNRAVTTVLRQLQGKVSAAARHDARQQLVRPMIEDLHEWLLAERARMSKHRRQGNQLHVRGRRPLGSLHPLP